MERQSKGNYFKINYIVDDCVIVMLTWTKILKCKITGAIFFVNIPTNPLEINEISSSTFYQLYQRNVISKVLHTDFIMSI